MRLNKTKMKEFCKKNGKAIAVGIGGGLAGMLGFYIGSKCTVNAIANDIATKQQFADLKTCVMLRNASNYVVESIDNPGVSVDKLKDIYDIALRQGFDEDSVINGVLIYGIKQNEN